MNTTMTLIICITLYKLFDRYLKYKEIKREESNAN